MFDYHVHSPFSVDCDTPMVDSCEAAIAAGITEIAFTDHVEHQRTDEGFGYYRIEDYFQALEAVRTTYGDRLTILAGAEVDFHSDTAEKVEQWIAKNGKRYDFVIGSVHYGEKGRIIFQEYYDDHTVEEVFLPYFDQIEMAIRTRWFDTIGHIDIPKRYLPNKLRNYDPSAYRDRLSQLFNVLIASSFLPASSCVRLISMYICPERSFDMDDAMICWYSVIASLYSFKCRCAAAMCWKLCG